MNYRYYSGQTFQLDQPTMNKMIEDVHQLRNILLSAISLLKDVPKTAGDDFAVVPKDLQKSIEAFLAEVT